MNMRNILFTIIITFLSFFISANVSYSESSKYKVSQIINATTFQVYRDTYDRNGEIFKIDGIKTKKVIKSVPYDFEDVAREYISNLILNKYVYIHKPEQINNVDNYLPVNVELNRNGASDRYILSHHLVKEGYAFLSITSFDTTSHPVLLKYEREAMENMRGMWEQLHEKALEIRIEKQKIDSTASSLRANQISLFKRGITILLVILVFGAMIVSIAYLTKLSIRDNKLLLRTCVGIILPFCLIGYMYLRSDNLLEFFSKGHLYIRFVISATVGSGIMLLIKHVYSSNSEELIPITTLVLSFTLWSLAFISLSDINSNLIDLYSGLVLGLLSVSFFPWD